MKKCLVINDITHNIKLEKESWIKIKVMEKVVFLNQMLLMILHCMYFLVPEKFRFLPPCPDLLGTVDSFLG